MVKILFDHLEPKLKVKPAFICQVTLNNDSVIEFRCDECRYSVEERIVRLEHEGIVSYFYIDDITLLEFKKVPEVGVILQKAGTKNSKANCGDME